MKAPPPTLIDRLYKGTFLNVPIHGWLSPVAMREKFRIARRFVLDDGMSTMLGELATAAFVPQDRQGGLGSSGIGGNVVAFEPRTINHRVRVAEQMRHTARAPFPVTWIEYPLRPAMIRSNELLHRTYDPDQSPQTEGWLIEQHPAIETAFMLSVFSGVAPGHEDDDGYDTWTFPMSYAWVSDDAVIPWRQPWPLPEGSNAPSEVATGMPGYITDRIGFAQNPLIDPVPLSPAIIGLIREWCGVMRRVLALMATLADLPIAYREVKAAKGFLGKGSYRRYLDHQTVTLTVPAKDYRKVARKAVAAARRRAHGVRGHWRVDWRHPLDPLCVHTWDATDGKHLKCLVCQGIKTFIPAHQRGDASLGLVTQDYKIIADPS